VFVDIQLIISDALRRRIRYPVWIHCCKRPNYDLCTRYCSNSVKM